MFERFSQSSWDLMSLWIREEKINKHGPIVTKLHEQGPEGPGAHPLESVPARDGSQRCAANVKMPMDRGTCGVWWPGLGGRRAVSLRAGGAGAPTAALCSLTGVCMC